MRQPHVGEGTDDIGVPIGEPTYCLGCKCAFVNMCTHIHTHLNLRRRRRTTTGTRQQQRWQRSPQRLQPRSVLQIKALGMFLTACRDCVSLYVPTGRQHSQKLSSNQSLLNIMLARLFKLKSFKLSRQSIAAKSFQLNVNPFLQPHGLHSHRASDIVIYVQHIVVRCICILLPCIYFKITNYSLHLISHCALVTCLFTGRSTFNKQVSILLVMTSRTCFTHRMTQT